MLQQWDYYYNRFKKVNPPRLTRIRQSISASKSSARFFGHGGGHNFEWWGQDNCMWSNDYPHGIRPAESRKYIDRDLGHLPPIFARSWFTRTERSLQHRHTAPGSVEGNQVRGENRWRALGRMTSDGAPFLAAAPRSSQTRGVPCQLVTVRI